MKKVIILSLILFIMIVTVTNVYATSNFEITLIPSSNEVSKNEEFTVDVRISNIQFNPGVLTLGGELEYDSDSLEIIDMKGENTWADPSYFDDTRIFVTDRGDYTTNEETVFKIKFKVKEQSKKNLVIKLKEVSASDGNNEEKLTNIATNITVKNGASNPGSDTNTTNNNTTTNNTNTNNNNNNNNNNSNKNNSINTNSNTNTNTNNTGINAKTNSSINNSDGGIKDKILPKTGATSIIFISIGILIIVAGIFYARIRIIDHKSKR